MIGAIIGGIIGVFIVTLILSKGKDKEQYDPRSDPYTYTGSLGNPQMGQSSNDQEPPKITCVDGSSYPAMKCKYCGGYFFAYCPCTMRTGGVGNPLRIEHDNIEHAIKMACKELGLNKDNVEHKVKPIVKTYMRFMKKSTNRVSVWMKPRYKGMGYI